MVVSDRVSTFFRCELWTYLFCDISTCIYCYSNNSQRFILAKDALYIWVLCKMDVKTASVAVYFLNTSHAPILQQNKTRTFTIKWRFTFFFSENLTTASYRYCAYGLPIREVYSKRKRKRSEIITNFLDLPTFFNYCCPMRNKVTCAVTTLPFFFNGYFRPRRIKVKPVEQHQLGWLFVLRLTVLSRSSCAIVV